MMVEEYVWEMNAVKYKDPYISKFLQGIFTVNQCLKPWPILAKYIEDIMDQTLPILLVNYQPLYIHYLKGVNNWVKTE